MPELEKTFHNIKLSFPYTSAFNNCVHSKALILSGINQCASAGVVTPILVKSNYRLQIARPVRGNDCIPIGRPSLIWGTAKNPPFGTTNTSPDNFLWSLTRRRVCCVGYALN